MTLKQGLTYKKHTDQILGYVDCGQYDKRSDFADQGVILMIRGLTLRWKQIIGYYLIRHNLSVCVLKQLISDAITALTNISLHVDDVVMDHESSQWKLVQDMGITPDQPWAQHDAGKFVVVPDPPHLLKNVRNNLMSKDVRFMHNETCMTAKWQHLAQLYQLDSAQPIRAVHRWNDNPFILSRGKKMKVILVCQVLSHSCAAAIRLYVSKDLLPKEALETACFVEQVNAMWDFVDSHCLGALTGKKPVTAKFFEEDVKRFDFFYNFVSSWVFLSKGKPKNIPSHTGWMLALRSLKALATQLIQETQLLNQLCLRKCNQDHIENMHSQIRGYNGFNYHPMVDAYVSAIRCLGCSASTTELLDKTISTGSNCLPDKEHGQPEIMIATDTLSVSLDENEAHIDLCDPVATSSSLSSIQTDIVEYIAGSVVKKILKKPKLYNICDECISFITASSSSDTVSLVTLKEFKQGALIRVSDIVMSLCTALEGHFQTVSKDGLPLSHPRQEIVSSLLKTFDLTGLALTCPLNHLNSLVNAILFI